MLNTPEVELGILLRAMTGAEHLARFGSPAWGEKLLAEHLWQAQAAVRAGCPWAREFVAAYRLALADYRDSLRALRRTGGRGRTSVW